MQNTYIIYQHRDSIELAKNREKSYTELIVKSICGIASGYAFLILFVLTLGVSNMTTSHIREVGEQVNVSFTIPLTPNRVSLCNIRVETLETVKIMAVFTIFLIVTIVSTFIFFLIKNNYNVFLILGLEYLPIPLAGKCLMAQGIPLYFIMFIIGASLICYSIALRTVLKPHNDEYR